MGTPWSVKTTGLFCIPVEAQSYQGNSRSPLLVGAIPLAFYLHWATVMSGGEWNTTTDY